MIDKAQYIQRFKDALEKQNGGTYTQEEAVEYFEILSNYYKIVLDHMSPEDKERAFKEMQNEQNTLSYGESE